jgi:hypothetical protein
MDAGVAALLGALVGVLGTAVTALTAARATRWQVTTQAQAEQNRWRRERRQNAYSGLLRSVTAVTSAIGETADALKADIVDPDRCDSLFSAARALGRDWEAASATLLMEGPSDVTRAARPLIKVINEECDTVRRWCAAARRNDGAAATALAEAYHHSRGIGRDYLEEFVMVARAAFDPGQSVPARSEP